MTMINAYRIYKALVVTWTPDRQLLSMKEAIKGAHFFVDAAWQSDAKEGAISSWSESGLFADSWMGEWQQGEVGCKTSSDGITGLPGKVVGVEHTVKDAE